MKIKTLKISFLFCAYILLVLGCKKEQIIPSGNVVTEVRGTGAFRGLSVAGSTPVYIQYGNDYKVELKGSDNMVARFSTKVENNILQLKYQDVNVKTDDLTVYVTMPVVSHLSISGSASLDVSGNFPAQESLDTFVSGSGNINFHGELIVNTLKGEIEGSGNSVLEQINAKDAELKITGSGDFKTTVSDHLTAKIKGSGNIYYFGTPLVVTDISGSGKVTRR